MRVDTPESMTQEECDENGKQYMLEFVNVAMSEIDT